MYQVSVKVKGTAPLLQHRFPMPDYEDMGKGGHQQSGVKDYRMVSCGRLWYSKCYYSVNYISYLFVSSHNFIDILIN